MTVINVFIFIGIIAAAISGSLVGMKKQLDLFGVICLGVATALGGGVLRDIMIGQLPPVAFIQPIYFFVSLCTSLLTWLFYKKVNKLQNVIMISDAVGLGVFTAVGANTALTHHMDAPFLVVSMGVITGIGGGILRDLLAKDIPYVFRKEIYAIASIVGAMSLFITYDLVPHIMSLYICLFITFIIRLIAVRYNMNFPVFKTDMEINKDKEKGMQN